MNKLVIWSLVAFGGLIVLAKFMGVAYIAFVFWPFGGDGSQAQKEFKPQEWSKLCAKMDCEQFPRSHMTYEIDGVYYYFPAAYKPDLIGGKSNWDWNNPSFGGSIPGARRAGKYYFGKKYVPYDAEKPIPMGAYVFFDDIGFETYLETDDDRRIKRGFAIFDKQTHSFGRQTVSIDPRGTRFPFLYKYFNLKPDMPEGLVNEGSDGVDFYSKDYDGNLFQLSHNLREDQEYNSFSDVTMEGFADFNDTFWLVKDGRDFEKYGKGSALLNVSFLSKKPMLMGRYVYALCGNYGCYFYTLKFDDEVNNPHPLIRLGLHGDWIKAFAGDKCFVISQNIDPDCDKNNVNYENMRKVFNAYEQVFEQLKIKPVLGNKYLRWKIHFNWRNRKEIFWRFCSKRRVGFSPRVTHIKTLQRYSLINGGQKPTLRP